MVQTARATGAFESRKPAEVHDLCAVRRKRHRDLVARSRDELVRGDEENALNLCLEALKLNRSYEALSLAGTLSAIVGELEDSVRFTREAIELFPRRADAYYDLASTLLDMGLPTEAVPWLERGFRLLGRRDDDLVDFMCGARIEALSQAGLIERAEEALLDARGRTDDPLGLIDTAEEVLESYRGRPVLRVV